jgi:hypothetical protein
MFKSENLMAKDHTEDLGGDGSIILKLSLKKQSEVADWIRRLKIRKTGWLL